MASTSTQPHVADTILPTYAKGVFAVLHMWPALRIAVQQGWGGSEGRTALAEDIVDLFYTTATESTEADAVPDQEDIEDVLLHVVSHAFNISLEDGSEVTIAKDLVGLWRECVARAVDPSTTATPGLMEKFQAAAEKAKAEDGVRKIEVHIEEGNDDSGDESGSGEDSDEEMEGVEQTTRSTAGPSRTREEPEVDEDGFQMVTKKGGRR